MVLILVSQITNYCVLLLFQLSVSFFNNKRRFRELVHVQFNGLLSTTIDNVLLRGMIFKFYEYRQKHLQIKADQGGL